MHSGLFDLFIMVFYYQFYGGQFDFLTFIQCYLNGKGYSRVKGARALWAASPDN
jgi:hypothetical protein